MSVLDISVDVVASRRIMYMSEAIEADSITPRKTTAIDTCRGIPLLKSCGSRCRNIPSASYLVGSKKRIDSESIGLPGQYRIDSEIIPVFLFFNARFFACLILW